MYPGILGTGDIPVPDFQLVSHSSKSHCLNMTWIFNNLEVMVLNC